MRIGEWGEGCLISSRDFATYLLNLRKVLESMVRLAVLMLTKSAGGLDKELRSSPGPVPQQQDEKIALAKKVHCILEGLTSWC